MRLRFTPRAIENLTEIAGYFAERNPAAGLGVRDDI
jgi:plasmid stabilization system protein ParE